MWGRADGRHSWVGQAASSILRPVLEQFNKALRPGLKQIGPPPPRKAITTGTTHAGPGTWHTVTESMSDRARAYQTKVTGAAPNTVYTLNGVKFDGFDTGVLIDAKGPGYTNFIKNGKFQKWWLKKGGKAMVKQAKDQLKAANGTPIQWRVAEPEAAEAIQKLLKRNRVVGIEVIHMPA